MENNSIGENIPKIKKLVSRILREHISNNEIVSEQVVPTLLKKYLGGNLLRKIETSMGDDVVRNLETLFAKGSTSIVTDAAGNVFLKSKSGLDVPMSTIQAAIKSVADGSFAADDIAKLLPRTLKDGTEFRSVFVAELKKAKPKPKVTAPKPAPAPKPAAGGSSQFTVPTIGAQFDDLSLVNVAEVEARLKNIFPKAPSSDIKRMSSNLKIANPRTQQEFEKSYMEAVNGYGPQYKKILSNPSMVKQMKDMYNSLPKWGKRIFWIITIPGGYLTLKNLGVPVDKLTGWVVNEWKNIITDQAQGVQTKLTSPSNPETPESGVGSKYN